MKIEKINDKKIKIFLSQEDLEEHNIKISEFITRSEKTQSFFKDMMEIACKTLDFYIDTNKFIIEAIPYNENSIVLIITKASDMDVTDILEKLAFDKNLITKNISISFNKNESICIYCFKSLDTIINLSKRLICSNNSSLFKYKNLYYLIVDTLEEENSEYINSILGEYGKKQKSSDLSKSFFLEHGEVIIKQDALLVLSKI